MKPQFFSTQADLRNWFEKNSETEKELIVGYYKKGTGRPSVDWPQSVDEAICFGWIDGVRKSINDESYQIRFTPRNPKSHWSTVNINKAEKLIKAKLMKPAGLELYKKRDKKKVRQASYEQQYVALSREYIAIFKKNKRAWDFFENKLAPSYKKTSIHWVVTAKQEETRLRRLNILIESSAADEKIPPLNISKK